MAACSSRRRCRTSAGGSSRTSTAAPSRSSRMACKQSLDLVSQEAVGATFALLVDSSASMSRRMDFVQRTAATLAGYMTARDRMMIAPFAKDIRRRHRSDQRSRHDRRGGIRRSGRKAARPFSIRLRRSHRYSRRRKAGGRWSSSPTATMSTARRRSTRRSPPSSHRAPPLYVVGIGGVAGISIKGERLLRQLAVETGGRFFFPSRDAELAEVHDVLTRGRSEPLPDQLHATEPEGRWNLARHDRHDGRSGARRPDPARLPRPQASPDPPGHRVHGCRRGRSISGSDRRRTSKSSRTASCRSSSCFRRRWSQSRLSWPSTPAAA